MFGISAAALAAYIAAKWEGSRFWTAFSVVCWSIVSLVILAVVAFLLALPIAAVKLLLTP
jgi:hypothetical protein